MASLTPWSLRLNIAAVFFLVCSARLVAAYEVPYCSSFNTADTPRNLSIYQSNSLCYNYCDGSTDLQKNQYALAVVSYQGCWCTDYAPATTTTGCDMACPGWQPEQCGSTDPVLYGYVELPRAVSGTRGPSSSTSSTSASQDAAPTPTPQQSSSSSSTTSSSTSSTWTPTPVTSLETITGQVRTVTVTPTERPNNANSQATGNLTQSSGGGSDAGGGGGGLGTGGAVGLTVGLVALVATMAAAIFFWIRQRRRNQDDSESLSRRGSSAGLGVAGAPSRTMSENSRYVLGTDGRRVIETWEPGENAELRKSRLIPVDQRLDPFSPVYQRGDNKSRESVNTIRDDHDYSRRMVTGGTGILRATNPD